MLGVAAAADSRSETDDGRITVEHSNQHSYMASSRDGGRSYRSNRSAPRSILDALAFSVDATSLLVGRSAFAPSETGSIYDEDFQDGRRSRSISFTSSVSSWAGSNAFLGLDSENIVDEEGVAQPEAESGIDLLPKISEAPDALEYAAQLAEQAAILAEPFDDTKAEDPNFGGTHKGGAGKELEAKDLHLSTLWQSVFNATNMLIGLALLSLPYAMSLIGWAGIPLIIAWSVITNYTGKLLGKCLDYQPDFRLREGPGGYTILGLPDMGYVAFGRAGRLFISLLFIAETLGYCVAFIMIEGQNLQNLLRGFEYFATWTNTGYMCLASAIFLPTVYLRNLAIISYLSAMGIVSSMALLLGILVSGLFSLSPSHRFCPEPCTGSILDPSPTDLFKMTGVPLCLGLTMCGFAGHAVVPTIRNDMRDKREYTRMLDITYIFTTFAYVTIAACGYLMFGAFAKPQVTLNLGATFVAHLTIWVIVINPLTKFSLCLSAVVLSVENSIILCLKVDKVQFGMISAMIRTGMVLVLLGIVLAVPHFGVILGLIGSVCAFTISITFPTACYLKMFWKQDSLPWNVLNVFLVILGITCTIIGTAAAVTDGTSM